MNIIHSNVAARRVLKNIYTQKLTISGANPHPLQFNFTQKAYFSFTFL